MRNCEFCAIVVGDHEAHVLREDEHTLAFLDENPAREGHTVVVPKAHREEVLAADDEVGKAVFSAVDAVAAALREELDPDGFSVFYTSGPLVGTVEHAHVHLVPRNEGDGVSLALDRMDLDPDAAAELVASVRNAT